MTRLKTEQILEDNQNRDIDSITALTLNQKALSDVSCLKGFKNLERLDLGFNNLSSLEGLKSCGNLKWLSVLQNKLQSLKGIEGLHKLTVLNAGKNKLRSMDEVSSLLSLRALILNDNEITSICKLDELKNLNTLVLSRNPIRDIGKSLIRLKLITKLSLSNCQLQTIGSSLVSCVDLKEVRLAHNEIMTLPAELTGNINLQNLDLGNNIITSWTDLKVVSSLQNLKNLNLQGNPIAENDKLMEKVKNLVPNLKIFNNRPIEKNNTNEKVTMKDLKVHRIDESSFTEEAKIENPRENKIFREGIPSLDVEKEIKLKKRKTKERLLKKDESSHGKNVSVDREAKKKRMLEQSKVAMIDDGETPFMDLIVSDSVENLSVGSGKKMDNEASQDAKSIGGLVTYPAKKMKMMKKPSMVTSALQLLSVNEVGMGGPSTWDA